MNKIIFVCGLFYTLSSFSQVEETPITNNLEKLPPCDSRELVSGPCILTDPIGEKIARYKMPQGKILKALNIFSTRALEDEDLIDQSCVASSAGQNQKNIKNIFKKMTP